jgi:hypothetical protein
LAATASSPVWKAQERQGQRDAEHRDQNLLGEQADLQAAGHVEDPADHQDDDGGAQRDHDAIENARRHGVSTDK